MSIQNAVIAGLAGEKLSRTITGTNQVSTGRSVIATGSGAFLGGVAGGAISVAASAAGLTTLATAASPIVVPIAVVSGAVGLIRSLWD